VEAAGECRGWCGALAQQGAGVGGGDRGRYRDADRPAELLGGVEEPGGKAGLVLGDPGQPGDRDRDEGKRGADPDDDEGPPRR
jgi:hypothetical protein